MSIQVNNNVAVPIFPSQVHPLQQDITSEIGSAAKKSLEDQKPDTTNNNDLVDKMSRNQTAESGLDLSYYFDNASPRASTTEESKTSKRGRSLSTGSTMSVIINQYQEAQQIHRRESVKKQQQKVIDFMNDINQQKNTDHYRQRVDKSSKKALQFFGEPIKLDISLKEIKREGLRALLYSSVPLGYFLYHLLNEYCSENLFFYLAVENYQQNLLLTYEEKKEVALYIMKTYLTQSSDLEVNLEDKIYRQIQQCLVHQNEFETITGKEFDLAKKHVFSLLNVSYHRFRTSSLWEVMESKCNAYTQHNKDRLQSLAVNLLTSFIAKHKNNNPTTSKLVFTFCKMYLPIGYQAYLNNRENNTKSVSAKTSTRRNRSKSLGNESRRFITSTFDIFRLSKK